MSSFSLTLSTSGLTWGPLELPLNRVVGVGVGVRRTYRPGEVPRKVIVAYRAPNGRLKKLVCPAEGQLEVDLKRALAGRWRGEAWFDEMNATLGFSNRNVKAVAAALIAIALVITAVVAFSVARRTSPSRLPAAVERRP